MTFYMLWNTMLSELQGGEQFPTGGKAREPFWLIRLNSEADGTVRMKEVNAIVLYLI